MKLFCKAFVAFLALLSFSNTPAFAQTASPERQDLSALQKTAEQFMRIQTNGMQGTVNIITDPVDSRTILPACQDLQAFLPNGGRLWGKTTIGVKCIAPTPWTIYVRATVQIIAEYIVTAVPLVQGQVIGPNDISKVKGDLSNLPSGIITEPSQAIGRTANISLGVGTPLRQDALRSNRVIQQGQVVRIVSIGSGFQITTEGRSLSNASEGQIAQAKTPAGQVVSGIAKAGGIIEINY